MGYMRHHAIVVTSWDGKLLNTAHSKAVALGMLVTNTTEDGVNGYHSFLVAPDGSKEGWDDSARGDAQRAEFVGWLDMQRYEDDSTSLDWVEVQYGDENYQTLIVNDSDERQRHDVAL